MATILAFVTAVGGWAALGKAAVAIVGIVASLLTAWKQYRAKVSTMNELDLANQALAGTIAVLDLMPQNPTDPTDPITKAKVKIKAFQELLATEGPKMAGLVEQVKALIQDLHLGNATVDNTDSASMVRLVDAIRYAKEIRLNRALELPTVGGGK